MSAPNVVVIDLGIYRTPGCEVYSGRDRGAAVRVAAGLDFLDGQRVPVRLTVPDDVILVARTFVLGLLAGSVESLGVDGTIARYGINDLRPGIRDEFVRALGMLA